MTVSAHDIARVGLLSQSIEKLKEIRANLDDSSKIFTDETIGITILELDEVISNLEEL